VRRILRQRARSAAVCVLTLRGALAGIGRVSGLRHTATSSRAVNGAGSNRPCSRNPLSGFSTCIGWPRLSLAVDGLGLTFLRCWGGRFSERTLSGALFLAVEMVAVAESLLEVPDGIDDSVDRTDELVACWRDVQSVFSDSCEFSNECRGVQACDEVLRVSGKSSKPIESIFHICPAGWTWGVSRGRTPVSTILYDIYCLMLL
jgi:hypothetical protein